jgi:uncharacterized membrane protein YphA (DoxX/SURF4 family)
MSQAGGRIAYSVGPRRFSLIFNKIERAALCSFVLDMDLDFGVQSSAARVAAACKRGPSPWMREAREVDTLLWMVQILLACLFLSAGSSKILAYDKLAQVIEAKSKGGRIGMSREVAALVGLLEIVGAVGLVVPIDLWPPHVVPRLAAGGLALLMVFAGIYHLRRVESAIPSVVLFLMALFVIVGRWPR